MILLPNITEIVEVATNVAYYGGALLLGLILFAWDRAKDKEL